MIRALVIGAEAESFASRLAEPAGGVEFETVRLPAAAIRAFERSPADIVVLCGRDADRLAAVLEALRERPLGRLVPCVGPAGLELDVDAEYDEETSPREAMGMLADLLGMNAGELGAAKGLPAEIDRSPLSESAIERKLRQVRHETYFDVLEVAQDVSGARLRDAFARLSEAFAPHRVSPELEHRFADQLAEVRDGLEDAYAVLANDRLRAAYTDPRR